MGGAHREQQRPPLAGVGCGDHLRGGLLLPHISMSVPFFSSLVALVTSATYLTCAYTLPCAFTLLLLRDRLSCGELTLCSALIPISILMSCAGFFSAMQQLLEDILGAPLTLKNLL